MWTIFSQEVSVVTHPPNSIVDNHGWWWPRFSNEHSLQNIQDCFFTSDVKVKLGTGKRGKKQHWKVLPWWPRDKPCRQTFHLPPSVALLLWFWSHTGSPLHSPATQTQHNNKHEQDCGLCDKTNCDMEHQPGSHALSVSTHCYALLSETMTRVNYQALLGNKFTSNNLTANRKCCCHHILKRCEIK